MGIRYLNTFLKTYPVALLHDIELHDIKVVIDGSELLYYLCYEYGKLDYRCGGEYTFLREITLQFFDCLRERNISSYVVFDAFKSESNLERCLKRRKEKLVKLRRIVDGLDSDAIEKPPHGKCVLRQTLSELQVPFVIVPGDADPEIAAIANSLDAPVLGGDTDFCILDIKEGFIPIKQLQWNWVLEDKKAAIRGKIFRRQTLLNTFGIQADALSYLVPIMSSQDGLLDVNFKNFLQHLSRTVRIPRHLMGRAFRRPNWIEVLLLWLANNYTNDDDTIDRITERVPNIPRAKFKELVRTFRDLPSVSRYIDILNGGKPHFDENEPGLTKLEGTRAGACFLPLLPDNQDSDSAHDISLSIRKAHYQIEIYKAQLEDEDAESRVIEMDRRGQNGYGMKAVAITVDHERLHCLRLGMTDAEAEAMEERRQYVFETLLPDPTQRLDRFKDLGTGLDVLAATFKYWRLNLTAPPPDAICRALAFTFAACNDGIQYEDLPDQLQSISDTEFDKDALHFSTQWQCCVMDTTRLNYFLGYPVSDSMVGKLFSGKFFQRAHAFFKLNGHMGDDRIAAEFLQGHDDAMALYTGLMELVRM